MKSITENICTYEKEKTNLLFIPTIVVHKIINFINKTELSKPPKNNIILLDKEFSLMILNIETKTIVYLTIKFVNDLDFIGSTLILPFEEFIKEFKL